MYTTTSDFIIFMPIGKHVIPKEYPCNHIFKAFHTKIQALRTTRPSFYLYCNLSLANLFVTHQCERFWMKGTTITLKEIN